LYLSRFSAMNNTIFILSTNYILSQFEKYANLYVKYSPEDTIDFFKNLKIDQDEINSIRISLIHGSTTDSIDFFLETIETMLKKYSMMMSHDEDVPSMTIHNSNKDKKIKIRLNAVSKRQLENKYPSSSNKKVDFAPTVYNIYQREWEVNGLDKLVDGEKFLIYCLELGFMYEATKTTVDGLPSI